MVSNYLPATNNLKKKKKNSIENFDDYRINQKTYDSNNGVGYPHTIQSKS